MRNPNRIKPYCDALASIWSALPNWRLSQFMINAIKDYTIKHGHDPFYVEDEEFIMYLFDYMNEIIKEGRQNKN